MTVFLFLHKNICFGYLLEVPRSGRGAQHMFWYRNKKDV